MGWRQWFSADPPDAPGPVNYADAVVDAILQSAGGSGTGRLTDGPRLGVVEACSAWWGRALATAAATPAGAGMAAVGPHVLNFIGRELARNGESLHVIDVDPAGRVQLLPCSEWDVRGSASPDTWTYRCNIAGPTNTEYRDPVPAAGVIHCRYSFESWQPWRGVSPLEAARTSGVLMAALERTLGEEVNGANAGLIPIQQTPEADDDANRLTTSIRNARGRTLAVTTSAAPISGGGMQGSAARGPSDMARRRIGAEPPSPLVTLRRDVEACISSIYGIPAALLTSATGASQAREDYRRVLHSVIVPLGRLVAEELAAKLDAPGARLEFRELGAADVQGRARAWRSLVGATESAAGMTPAEASAVVGFGD